MYRLRALPFIRDILTIACLLWALPLAAQTRVAAADIRDNVTISVVDYRGWDYVVNRLIATGIDEATLRSIYQDPRMPVCGPIPFSLAPKEHPSIYAGFMARGPIDLAHKFLKKYPHVFESAKRKHGVSGQVIAAILLVESHFGANTGKELVINRISRLAALGSSENIEYNYERLRRFDRTVTREALRARSRYLEETFTPEIPALLQIARRNNLDLLTLKGSSAGAFGMPQFLPSSYIQFAVDGDEDGVTSLYDVEDAIFSTANFLKSAGWNEGLSFAQKRKVIWRYNKSDEYITTILRIADRLRALHK